MIAGLITLVYEASPANLYATFVNGPYDPETRRLSYVSVGHYAPMVFRSRAGGVDQLRVESKGPVIGLLPAATYTQCAIDLTAGDLVFDDMTLVVVRVG